MTERSAPPRGPDGGPDSGPVDLLRRFPQGADAHDHELRPRAAPPSWIGRSGPGVAGGLQEVLSGTWMPSSPTRIQSSWGRALTWASIRTASAHRACTGIREIRRLRAEHPLAPFVPALAGLLGDDSVVGTHISVIAQRRRGAVAGRFAGCDPVGRESGIRRALAGQDAVGTNAIGSTVVEGRANQVFSVRAPGRSHHNWVCSAAPVYDPETRALLGVLDVSGPYRNAHPDALALVRCGAAWCTRCSAAPSGRPTNGPATWSVSSTARSTASPCSVRAAGPCSASCRR